MLGVGAVVAAGPSGAVVVMAADPPPTAFGAVVKPQGKQTYPNALAQSESRYGRLGVIRYFDANAPDAWSDYTARWGDRSAILSFRISHRASC